MLVILLRLLRSQLRLRLEMATLGIVETSFPSALAETPYSPILGEEFDRHFDTTSHDYILFYHVRAHEGLQHFGQADAFGALIVFQQGCHDAWEREGTAIQGVAYGGLFVALVFETQFQAVCLEFFEVGNRADFQPFFLGFGVDFKVVSEGGSEADVPSAETDNPVGKFQFNQKAFYMLYHAVEGFVRNFRAGDLHDFHFVELVQTVQPTDIFAVGTCLAAETSRVCRIFNRQAFAFDNHVPVDVGDGHFSSRDKLKVVFAHVVHLPVLVRKLPGTVTGISVHHEWGLYFLIAGACIFV